MNYKSTLSKDDIKSLLFKSTCNRIEDLETRITQLVENKCLSLMPPEVVECFREYPNSIFKMGEKTPLNFYIDELLYGKRINSLRYTYHYNIPNVHLMPELSIDLYTELKKDSSFIEELKELCDLLIVTKQELSDMITKVSLIIKRCSKEVLKTTFVELHNALQVHTSDTPNSKKALCDDVEKVRAELKKKCK